MGDRGNIFVPEPSGNGEGVYLYSHWGGSFLPDTVARGLDAGRSRWGDTAYLTRILFDTLTEGDPPTSTTGYGISTTIQDNEHPIVEVHDGPMMVVIGDRSWTYEEFVEWGQGKTMDDLSPEE